MIEESPSEAEDELDGIFLNLGSSIDQLNSLQLSLKCLTTIVKGAPKPFDVLYLDDILIEIFRFLDSSTLLSIITRVSSLWRHIALNHSVWQIVSLRSLAFNLTSFRLSQATQFYSNVRVLDLATCRELVEDDLIGLFRKCHQLAVVCLSRIPISNYVLQVLSENNPNLVVLNIHQLRIVKGEYGYFKYHGSRCTDEGIEILSKNCPKLFTLSLENCSSLTDNAIFSLSNYLPNLYSLTLKRVKLLTNEGLGSLSRLSSLRILDLKKCKLITDEGIKYLSNCCHEISSLKLSQCSLITDQAIKYLAKGCKKLHALSLVRCINITNIESIAEIYVIYSTCLGIQIIIEEMKQLKYLDLTGCGISRQAIRLLCVLFSQKERYDQKNNEPSVLSSDFSYFFVRRPNKIKS